MLQKGDRAPDFALADSAGRIWTSADFKGKTYVLYFYPRDDTPGCTKEACGFRDGWAEYAARGIPVVGVSPDSGAAHAKFIARYSLPFILLSDPGRTLLAAFGAYGEKTMYGKIMMGVIRSTFVIGGDGMILRAFPKVKPEGHAEEILQGL